MFARSRCILEIQRFAQAKACGSGGGFSPREMLVTEGVTNVRSKPVYPRNPAFRAG